MVNLRSGKKVPFLGKNIPKRPYSYKTPIQKEEEIELVAKIASISIHEKDVLPEMPETDADNNVTYGSMPSLEGSVLEENSSNSDVTETNIQSNFQSDPEVRVKAKSTKISFLVETYPDGDGWRSNQGLSERYGGELSAHKKPA